MDAKGRRDYDINIQCQATSALRRRNEQDERMRALLEILKCTESACESAVLALGIADWTPEAVWDKAYAAGKLVGEARAVLQAYADIEDEPLPAEDWDGSDKYAEDKPAEEPDLFSPPETGSSLSLKPQASGLAPAVR